MQGGAADFPLGVGWGGVDARPWEVGVRWGGGGARTWMWEVGVGDPVGIADLENRGADKQKKTGRCEAAVGMGKGWGSGAELARRSGVAPHRATSIGEVGEKNPKNVLNCKTALRLFCLCKTQIENRASTHWRGVGLFMFLFHLPPAVYNKHQPATRHQSDLFLMASALCGAPCGAH